MDSRPTGAEAGTHPFVAGNSLILARERKQERRQSVWKATRAGYNPVISQGGPLLAGFAAWNGRPYEVCQTRERQLRKSETQMAAGNSAIIVAVAANPAA